MQRKENYRRAILAWHRKVPAWKRWFLWRFLGRDFCPRCRKPMPWQLWLDNPIHPEGPPLFMEWACKACGLSTGIEPTPPCQQAIDNHSRYQER